MWRGGGGGGCDTAVREEHVWTLDSIETENYTLIYAFSKLIGNFTAFHGWLLDDCRGTCSQLTPTAPAAEPGKAGARSIPSSTRAHGRSVVQATTELEGTDKVRWSPFLVASPGRKRRRAAVPPASPATPAPGNGGAAEKQPNANTNYPNSDTV